MCKIEIRFSAHSRIRAKTEPEAERIGKYINRPVLDLERLSLLEPEGKVGYRYGKGAEEVARGVFLSFRDHGARESVIFRQRRESFRPANLFLAARRRS